MHTPEEVGRMRVEIIAHLEAALALSDEKRDSTAGYLIETALDAARADMLPGNLDLRPRVKR
jgi:hypothetical protein